MKKSHRLVLIADHALIAITNAIALGGAVYNRSGEPDSTLALSDRELQLPCESWSGSENSELSLRLNWRVLQESASGEPLSVSRAHLDGPAVAASPAALRARRLGLRVLGCLRMYYRGRVWALDRRLPRAQPRRDEPRRPRCGRSGAQCPLHLASDDGRVLAQQRSRLSRVGASGTASRRVGSGLVGTPWAAPARSGLEPAASR
jgi:hypothetical protein